MFFRYFALLCAIAFFAVFTNAAPAEEIVEELQVPGLVEYDEDIEARNPLLQAAIRIISAVIKWAAKNCIKEAAQHCKQHWNHPGNLINCAKNYLQANKGRCALG